MLNNLVVLIVDDQHDVLDSLRIIGETAPTIEILAAQGFGAATVWIEAAKRIDLLLTNIHLPDEFSGMDIARVAMAAHPKIAVVMMSTEALAPVDNLPPRFALIQKPFDISDLADHVDRAFLQSSRVSNVHF